MKITYYSYNAFIVEWEDKKIAIDPGALFAYWFSFAPLIPKKEWSNITHVFVTHGDPDHYWHTDKVLKASEASIIFNESMIEQKNGETFMLGPRSKGVSFDTPISNFHTLTVDNSIEVDGMHIRGIKTSHGPLTIKMGPIKKTEYPEKNPRLGWGSIGFEIKYKGTTIVNLGDTLLKADAWQQIKNPDVLMIPIGGGQADNTMDEYEALEAIKIIQPKLIIPMHYDMPLLFTKHYASVDENKFTREVEIMHVDCKILKKGQSLVIN